MQRSFKAFTSRSRAMKAARGLPIIQVRNVYLVQIGGDLLDLKLTEVELIRPDGGISGHITMQHLNRLGNANYAAAHPAWKHDDIFTDKAQLGWETAMGMRGYDGSPAQRAERA